VFNTCLNAQTNSGSESKNKKEIDIHYNWAHIGNNISINYNHYIGRHAVTLGIKKHYNEPITDNQGYVYKKRGYAQNNKESIGLNIGYRFDILKNREIVTPYFFFQSQISNLRFRRVYENIDIVDNKPTISEYTTITSPRFITENVIGIGMTTKIFKNFYLNQSAGIGVSTFKSKDDGYYPASANKTVSDPASLIRMGLTYRLN